MTLILLTAHTNYVTVINIMKIITIKYSFKLYINNSDNYFLYFLVLYLFLNTSTTIELITNVDLLYICIHITKLLIELKLQFISLHY